jgi:hypothetical protein
MKDHLKCESNFRFSASPISKSSFAYFKIPSLGPLVLLITVALRWRWNWIIGGIKLTGENRSTRKETCNSATSCTINPVVNGPESKSGRRKERPAINCLSHGSPFLKIIQITYRTSASFWEKTHCIWIINTNRHSYIATFWVPLFPVLPRGVNRLHLFAERLVRNRRVFSASRTDLVTADPAGAHSNLYAVKCCLNHQFSRSFLFTKSKAMCSNSPVPLSCLLLYEQQFNR